MVVLEGGRLLMSEEPLREGFWLRIQGFEKHLRLFPDRSEQHCLLISLSLCKDSWFKAHGLEIREPFVA